MSRRSHLLNNNPSELSGIEGLSGGGRTELVFCESGLRMFVSDRYLTAFTVLDQGSPAESHK